MSRKRLTQREDGSTVAREVPLVSTEPVASNPKPARDGRTCGHLVCESCGVSGTDFKLQATGATRRVLFDWQQGVGGPSSRANGPRHTVETDGHDEAEAKCLACSKTFWSLSPVILMDAQGRSIFGE